MVEELANTSNRWPLGQISFLSELAVERGGLPVARGNVVNLEDSVVNTPRQNVFNIRNTGVGRLLFGTIEPVQITGDTYNVFSVVQPTGAEIAPNDTLPFTINFTPRASQTYTATVTIRSNDPVGDHVFTITAIGVAPKPIATVIFGDTEIGQSGTIDVGEVLLTQSQNITITIRNDGTQALEIDQANITIGGADASSYSILSRPSGTVSAGGQSSFMITSSPVRQGENYATLIIPTNDGDRNPVIVNLRTIGVQGFAVMELRRGNVVIANDLITPVDFGQVEVGNHNQIVFTVRNTGNIPLELTGDPAIESSSPFFSIPNQPANRSVNPGGEISFALRYTPVVEGEDTGTITIMNNTAGLAFTFRVRGSGNERRPQVTVRQGVTTINQHGAFDFGTIAAGRTSEITFAIGNSGDANLTFVNVDGNRVNLLDNSAGLFTVTHQPTAAAVVTPGSTTNFSIRFNPDAAGTNFTATVRIETNSRNYDEFSFTIRGNARAANSEARLSDLQFSQGTLTPAFNANIYAYDLRVPVNTTLVNVRPTSMDANITSIHVNGVPQASGVLSQDIILDMTSTVTILVTAEDGTSTATYAVNIVIVRTWERLHGQVGGRWGIFRAISNGQGGIYAGGYVGNNTGALFNIDGSGNILDTFTFPSYEGTIGPRAMGSAYNDFFAVHRTSDTREYFITRATHPSVAPVRSTSTRITFHGHPVQMFPVGITRNNINSHKFVAGNAHFAASPTATQYSLGIFVNRHLINGNWESGVALPLNISGTRAESQIVMGMTMLANGDVLLYGNAETIAGRSVAFAAAVNVSNANSGLWSIRWSTVFESGTRATSLSHHFWDNQSNLVLVGGSEGDGLVVRFPGNVTTAAGARPAGWPRLVSGINGAFGGGLATSNNSGYVFVGEHNGDVWVVKTDLNANTKIWENFFGGTGSDFADAIVEVASGFIVAGATLSPAVAGQTRTGLEDIYILKINSDGTMD